MIYKVGEYRDRDTFLKHALNNYGYGSACERCSFGGKDGRLGLPAFA